MTSAKLQISDIVPGDVELPGNDGMLKGVYTLSMTFGVMRKMVISLAIREAELDWK
jgi:hypothetical protein